jgi:predicted TIM-barrel fold metal-dependent hydrolase
MTIHNCHTHIFSFQTIPEYALPCGLIRFLAQKEFSRPLARCLNRLNPASSDDLFDRYAAFLSIGSRSQAEIFQTLQASYPVGTRFVVLTMDQAYREAGRVPQPFEEQLAEVAALKERYGDVLLPFICVDPRREHIVELALECFRERGFAGIKLYPQYGYFPYDDRLDSLYQYAETHQIPIIPHTASAIGDYRGDEHQLRELLNQCKFEDIDIAQIVENLVNDPRRISTKRQKICSFFGHPVQYLYLLNQYPRLKISFAHMGGNYDWDDYIQNPLPASEAAKYDHIVAEIKRLLKKNPKTEEEKRLLKEKLETAFGLNWLYLLQQIIREYENTYADISFTLSNQHYFSLLKELLGQPDLRPKILFGTDYYMVEIVTSEENFNTALSQALEADDYRQITEINPQAFL